MCSPSSQALSQEKRLACVACSMCCILYACSMCCIRTARHIEKFVLYVAQRSCTANIAWHAPCETHAGSLRNQLVLTGLGKGFEATVCIVVQSHVQPPGDHHTHTDVSPPIVCKLPLPMMLETVLPHSSLHCESCPYVNTYMYDSLWWPLKLL